MLVKQASEAARPPYPQNERKFKDAIVLLQVLQPYSSIHPVYRKKYAHCCLLFSSNSE